METLSNSVSSIKIPTLKHHPSLFNYYKTSYPYSHNQNLSHLLSSSTASIIKFPSLIENQTPASTNTNFSHTQFIKKPPSALLHRKPATGYAAALIDIAKLNNSLELESVNKGVRKLRKWLKNDQIRAVMNDLFGNEMAKGEILKELVEKGRLNKHLVALVKILVKKGRVGIVGEVLSEFERIYDELCGTQVVFISCDKKLGKEEAFDIARRVQCMSGALKVKVRSLVAC